MTMLLELPVVVAADAEAPQAEAAARRDLRRQVARLEARGGHAPGGRGPRLLGLAELETLRDAMLPPPASPADDTIAVARLRLEAMLTDPAGHRRERVSLAELGLPGCGAYRARPRLGLVVMLAGWWEITLSSGCP